MGANERAGARLVTALVQARVGCSALRASCMTNVVYESLVENGARVCIVYNFCAGFSRAGPGRNSSAIGCDESKVFWSVQAWIATRRALRYHTVETSCS